MTTPARIAALAASALLAGTPLAAAEKKAPAVLADLAFKAQKHGLACPLPKQGPCAIKKPVGPSYRLLTPGVVAEDLGDYWLVDFAKAKDPKSRRLTLRVLGESSQLHEIEVRFPPDPTAAAAGKAKEAQAEPPKEAGAETAK